MPLVHPDAIAEQRPSAEGAAGIDSNDADGIMVVAKQLHQFVNGGAFPRTWRACNTDIVRAPRMGIYLLQYVWCRFKPPFDYGYEARYRALIALE